MKFTDPRLEEIRCLLIESMFMLEMHGDGIYSDDELVAAGHSMVQRAGALLAHSGPPPEVTARGKEILAEEAARMAIADAQEASKHV
jgi:hypothetical protein